MKILTKSANTMDITKYLSILIRENFIIEKIEVEEAEWLEPDEGEKYYPKYYITIEGIEDLIKLRKLLNKDIILSDSYFTPMCDLIEENVLIIYDDYLE